MQMKQSIGKIKSTPTKKTIRQCRGNTEDKIPSHKSPFEKSSGWLFGSLTQNLAINQNDNFYRYVRRQKQQSIDWTFTCHRVNSHGKMSLVQVWLRYFPSKYYRYFSLLHRRKLNIGVTSFRILWEYIKTYFQAMAFSTSVWFYWSSTDYVHRSF